MKVDPEKCTKCGLCIENCCFSCWENDADDIPKMKEGNVGCFSCFNCMVACPVDAVEIVDTWHVDGPVFNKGWPEHKMPLEPRDAEGNPSEWNVVERTVLERRSVRNFKDEPVSDHMIRRILEAGRFAPSATNGQPWKFTVVTDPAILKPNKRIPVNPITCNGRTENPVTAFIARRHIFRSGYLVSPA